MSNHNNYSSGDVSDIVFRLSALREALKSKDRDTRLNNMEGQDIVASAIELIQAINEGKHG